MAVGYTAGREITTGVQNTLIGALSGGNITDADQNVAIGYAALTTDTLGSRSVAIGRSALETQNFTTATNAYNIAIGYDTGAKITTGVQNTLIGGNTGDALTTGSQCTFIGMNAGGAATTGTFNAFLGRSSGSAMTTGSKNTIIGSYNGNQGSLDIRTSSNNIVLSDGDGNPRLTVNTAGQIAFGTSNGSTDISGGTIGLALNDNDGRQMLDSRTNSNINTYRQRFYNTNGLVGAILTNGSTTSFSSLSDYRLKENVVYDWDATARLQQLKPVRFNFIADPTTTIDGFLAHEVQEVVPEAVSGEKDATDDNGIVSQSLDPAKIVPLLVKAIQEQQALITALTDRITALEG